VATLREILLYGDSLDLTSHLSYRHRRAMAAPLKSNAIIVQPTSRIVGVTYEVSHNEPLHPDVEVAARMYEVGLSLCKFGCKVYADPWSNVRVIAHNQSYGCTR